MEVVEYGMFCHYRVWIYGKGEVGWNGSVVEKGWRWMRMRMRMTALYGLGENRILADGRNKQIGLMEPKYSIQKMQQTEAEQRAARSEGATDASEGR